MECLRSFNFIASGQSNFVAPDVKTWTSGTETFYTFERNGLSTFTPQGFKNIDVYGVSVIGNFGTFNVPVLGGAIPSDWAVKLVITGQVSLLGGIIQPTNDFGFDNSAPQVNTFKLGRFNPDLKFEDPIKSVTSIQLTQIESNGTGVQTVGEVNLQYLINFIVYYKFEGE
jgi:hypothetical protein